jgi:hypothetical protein
MSYYRLYFMNKFNGHIERFEEFEARDDGEAAALAECKRGALGLELWCSHRKVAQLDALDLSSKLLAERRASKAVKDKVGPELRADTSRSENRSE